MFKVHRITSYNVCYTKLLRIWVLGRADEVLNVAGHRIGTAELEHELVSNKMVAEAAIVGKPDDIKGEVPVRNNFV